MAAMKIQTFAVSIKILKELLQRVVTIVIQILNYLHF